MPRTPKKSLLPFTPYKPRTPSQSPIPKCEIEEKSDSSTSPSPNLSAKRPWTSDELMQLYDHVKKNGSKTWEGAVQGRTSNQCYKVWNQTIDPYLKNAIISKGKAERGGF
ncbi:hypothetical protein I204_05308 [Kwoniella mangroviensis CBS 8886]|uniref:uncharacterized protein n=1 Tax=Kwoniella mangroviensis CBS 8507 TaxID=1296122 RepID=UPI00080CD0F7|nr:uncharacterized protein I203_04661 [Kwoniella mangroviensis CBS 8507]OCF66330.1 hypothetical protein I203_04661 [Kwoniella mangroviensis CBS 8507]OCF73467.1 hypothetical protein I204_05308 [Kwoniella mangroviensis CBS 8886]